MNKERFENIKQKYYLGYRSSLSLQAKKYIPKKFIINGLNEGESKLIWKRRIMNIIMNNDYDTVMEKLKKLENSEETTESNKLHKLPIKDRTKKFKETCTQRGLDY
jgi:hypothetical protein